MNNSNIKNPFHKFFTTGMNTKKLAKFSSVLIMIFIFALSFGKIAYADPTFIVNNSTAGQVTFSGQGLTGVTHVDINLTRNSNGQIQPSNFGVDNGSFSDATVPVFPGENYTYLISDSDAGSILKSGTFQAKAASPVSGGGGNPGNSGGGGDPGDSGGGGDPGDGGGGGDPGDTNTPPQNSSDPIVLENPLKGIGTIPEFIDAILRIVFKIGSWILALFIIYVGYKFVAARGNEKELTEAKEALKYTLIGGAILMGAWVIAEAIVGTVNALK